MDYKNTIETIKEVSLNNYFIKSFDEGDVYDINNKQNNEYPKIVLSPLNHNLGFPTSQLNFNIFYIDTLLKDESNKIDIHNYSIKIISDILIYLENNYDFVISNIKNLNIETFTEKI